jgi:hypothetical protein
MLCQPQSRKQKSAHFEVIDVDRHKAMMLLQADVSLQKGNKAKKYAEKHL